MILSDDAESDADMDSQNESSAPLPDGLKRRLIKIKEHARNLFSADPAPSRDPWSLAPNNDCVLKLICGETLKDTWLDSPCSNSVKDESISDWLDSKHCFPNLKSRKSHIPPKGHAPYFPVPFAFSDNRTKDFIEAKVLTNTNIIKVEGNAMLHGAPVNITASTHHKSIALIDKLLRDSLGEVLGVTGLLKFLFDSFAANDNQNLFELTQNILFIVIFSLLRARDLHASSLLKLREILRAQTLVKLKGKPASDVTKESLRYSDFGLPSLFGPVRDGVESLVSPSIRGVGATDFQLSLADNKSWPKGGYRKKAKTSTPKQFPSSSAPNSQPSVFPKGSSGKKRKKKIKGQKPAQQSLKKDP